MAASLDQTSGSAANVALALVSLLIDELVRGGMRHACVSPGSRSTPIALALDRHPHVDVHVHVDERASAFVALGIAKATGSPVGIACTSGTAAANFLPALVEASMSRTPLVVLTADRPPELRGVGANQTIDQRHLFGSFVRRFVDADVPRIGDGAVAHWRGLGADAVADALGHPRGPVHVNLPFREPLAPAGAPIDLPEDEPRRPPAHPKRGPSESDVDALVGEIWGVERGVILAGSLREVPRNVYELAKIAGWPLVAEPTSGLRTRGEPGVPLIAGQQLLASDAFAATHTAEVVLQLGAAPTSRAGQAFETSSDRLLIVDPDGLVADPGRRATHRFEVDASALVNAAITRIQDGRPGDSPWLRRWRDADAIAADVVWDLLESWDEPFEGRIARDLAATIAEGFLFAGSSMPVRDLDAFMLPRHGLRVLGNRGASGIDGGVSTILGLATAAADPTYGLLGDLSLLHDAGSLLWSGGREAVRAVIVVANNDGGGIFSFLPQRELPEHERLFTTPHALDLGALAAAARVGHTRVERAGDFIPALGRATRAGGVQLVEVVVDRELNVARHAEVARAVTESLRGTNGA